MANEIKVLGRYGDTINLLFLFPVNSPAQIGGVNVVETPSSGLDELESLACDSTEKASLDAGTMVAYRRSFQIIDGWSNGQLAQKARALYAADLAAETARYQKQYQYAGTELNP